MPHPPRFQVLVLPNADWPELCRRYRHVEELGFEIAGIADHFVDWTSPDRPWLEAWTLLAALARETTRLRLATLVAQIPLRGPAVLAHQALTVDHLSGGRLELGLGVGLTSDPSCEMMGLPSWDTAERVARFPEYVELVDRLLTQEVTTYEGRFYRATGAVMHLRPVQRPRPPLTIAALGPRMLRHAARYADTWNSLSFAATFETQVAETRSRMQQVDEHCAAIGRDPATLRRSYLMFDVQARRSGGLISYYRSESAFSDMAEPLLALGLSELGLYYPTRQEQWPVFERIATDVLPRLRSRHRAGPSA